MTRVKAYLVGKWITLFSINDRYLLSYDTQAVIFVKHIRPTYYIRHLLTMRLLKQEHNILVNVSKTLKTLITDIN